MDHPSLEYFVEIARQLNISKAANNLHISQQSLSAYIQKLERHYGVMLFIRRPKLELTPAGERILLAAEEMEQVYQELARDLNDMKSNADIRVSLGIFEPFVSLVMKRLPIIEIGKRYPNVSFHIIVGYNKDILEKMSKNELDLAIVGMADVTEQTQEQLATISLSQDEDCIIMTEEVLRLYFADEYDQYVEKFSKGTDILDLSHVPIIMHPMESGISKKIRKYFMDNHRTFKVFGEGPSQEVINSMVLKSKAFGLCNSMDARLLVKRTEKKVHVFPLEKPKIKRDIVLLYQKKNSYLEEIAGMIAENWSKNVESLSFDEEEMSL